MNRPRRRPRRRGRREDTRSRRSVLRTLIGGGVLVFGGATSLASTGAFTTGTATRDTQVGVAGEGNGIVGLTGRGPVQKQSRDPMVDIANNGSQPVTVTVSLSNPSDGGLYDNDDESDADSVTFTLDSGFTRTVDIVASVTGTIPYSVSVSSSGAFSLDATREVESESGNVKGAVVIGRPNKDQDFSADVQRNEFNVEKINVYDDDGDDDLAKITFTVQESATSTVVGSKTLTFDPPVAEYKPSGKNLPEVIQPDSGYTIQSGANYSLTTTGEDADGNTTTETVDTTA